MAAPATDTAAKPSSGRWIWNDEAQELEFISSEAKVEVKEVKKTKTSTYQEHFRKHLEKWQSNTARSEQLEAFKTSITRSQKSCVTIQDIKLAAVCLLQDNDGLPIPLTFLKLIKSKELDGFLASLLFYFSCFFEKKVLEERTKSLTVNMILQREESVSEQQVSAELQVKLDQAQKTLAFYYATLLLDEDLALQPNTARHGIKVSSPYCDIQLYECLFSFCGYAVWVTLERRDLKAIQLEIGRLFRSNTFNPALRILDQSEDRSQEEGQSELEEQTQGSNRRPALKLVLRQRSPLMASYLPMLPEDSQQLFKRFRCLKKPSTEHVNQLIQQINNLSLGILGKPLNQFSSRTLKPHNEEELEDDEDADVMKVESRLHIRSSNQQHCSRVEIFSRATTEAPDSDTL
nr:protein phosphatase 1 regulatory subunit 36 [Danio rerio]|eukprot:XP_009292739.1 protein phosphatase 1 regulatory subunit 36 [Danio rerio]